MGYVVNVEAVVEGSAVHPPVEQMTPEERAHLGLAEPAGKGE